MKSVPYHIEVVNFAEKLAEILRQRCSSTSPLPAYEVACAHEHSCCVCIANRKFFDERRKKWRTWINYDEFYRLWNRWKLEGTPYTKDDFAADTPDWAVYGSAEAGFDPSMVRYRKVRGINKRKLNNTR
mmetsp:Transcript_17850/g.43687  ORF Transcript_17850/g.43687 Transcript_17850/m.43687 type:complete len:129 (-) Transcript_17850:170-556(-)